ncbi:MAG: GumC family protein [Cyclobacteriaceae bacterium]
MVEGNDNRHNENTMMHHGESGQFSASKMLEVFRKTWYWMVLIILITTTIAYLKARWTRPLYQSNSVLQLDIKRDASVLGFRSFDENINNISREIEFIKSNLFFSQVAKIIDNDINYYEYGNVLYDERYKGSPFHVYYSFNNNELYDRNIDVELNELSGGILKYEYGAEVFEQRFNFGDSVISPHATFVISRSASFDSQAINKRYFFRINSLQGFTRYLSENTVVQPLDFNARTITISFKDYNPLKARDILTAIDTLYIYFTQFEKNLANNQKIEFLNQQLSQTEEKLSELENYFENFTITNRTTDLNQNLGKTILWLERLDSQRFEIEKKIELTNNVYGQMMSEAPLRLNPMELAIFPTEMAADLRLMSELSQERDMLTSSFKENTLVYNRKVREIDSMKKSLIEFVDDFRKELLNRRDALIKDRRRLEEEFIGLPSKRTEFSKTERYYALYEEFYLSLIQSKAEFELAQAGTVTDFKILTPANISSVPLSPNKLLYYAFGFMAGLFIGLVMLFTRYLMHNKITDQQQIEQNTQLPILGVIPYYSKVKGLNNRLVIDKRPRSALSEAFRNLRTNLEFLDVVNKNPVISVSSTISGEGKTFVAVNLGGVISLLGNKVVLLDLDMRKPRLQKVFYNSEQNQGISTILIGKHTVEECLLPTTLENLSYISSGPIPPNPAELINSQKFMQLIARLKEIFDTIIIDTPPVGLVTDGIVAMKQAGLKIYVIRSDYSKLSFIDQMNRMQKVHHFDNLAIVLNSDGHGKDNIYGKGYGYYDEEDAKKGFLRNILDRMGRK